LKLDRASIVATLSATSAADCAAMTRCIARCAGSYQPLVLSGSSAADSIDCEK
jgi:hypothetical protein